MDQRRLRFKRVFITGAGGYVGSALVPRLLEKDYEVIAYDLFFYGDTLPEHPRLRKVRGDIRDRNKLIAESRGADACIHLACISNDPSFDLDPELGKSINFDAFHHVIAANTINGIRRLIVASSTSQYGIKPLTMSVTEDTPAEPITDYAKYKIECEQLLHRSDVRNLEYIFVRPATLCGYAPRLRLDLSVNILAINALVNKKIKIFGGEQMRPALNMKDMVRFYELMLEAPGHFIHRQAFNVSHSNMTMMQIGEVVKKTIGDPSVVFEVVPTNDTRSYHISTEKMKLVLGFYCQYSIEEAVQSVMDAYAKGLIVDGLNNPLYHNIKRMNELKLV